MIIDRSKDDGLTPFGKSFFGQRDEQRIMAVYKDTAEGHLHRTLHHFHIHDGRDEAIKDRILLVSAFLNLPETFKKPKETFDLLTQRDFSFEEFFETETDEMGKDVGGLCWSLYARAPSREMLDIAAVMTAEWIRYGMIRKEGYKINLDDLIEARPEVLSLGHELHSSQRISFLMAVQNRLVDYVEQEGAKLPLHRGAAFLRVFDDNPQAILWTRKIESVGSRDVFHPQKGNIKRVEINFTP